MKIKTLINNFINNKHFLGWSIFSLFLLVITDISTRIFIEIFTVEKNSPYGILDLSKPLLGKENFQIFQYYSLFYVENICYFLILFFLLISLVSFFVKNKSIEEIIKTSIVFYPLIVIPPLIDYFIFHRHYGYDYGNSHNFLIGFFTLTWKGYNGKGISTLVTIGVLTTSLYVYFNTKSFIKAFLTFWLTDLIIVGISMPNLFFGKGNDNFLNPMFLSYYYFIPLFIISLIFAKLTKLKINYKFLLLSVPIFLLYFFFKYYKISFLDNFNIVYTDYIKNINNNYLYFFEAFYFYVVYVYISNFFIYIKEKYFNFINIYLLFYIFLINRLYYK